MTLFLEFSMLTIYGRKQLYFVTTPAIVGTRDSTAQDLRMDEIECVDL